MQRILVLHPKGGSGKTTVATDVLAQDMSELTKPADVIIAPALPSDIDIRHNSQNYVRAAEQGVGLHEIKQCQVEQDLEDCQPRLAWLRAKELPVAVPVAVPLPETA